MNIKVLFFANFKEQLGTTQLEIEMESGARVKELCVLLSGKGPVWQAIFEDAQRNVKVSINQEMAEMTSALHSQDEVAFFPPVTGG